MSTEERIPLLLSREVEQLLADNGTGLGELLARDHAPLRVEAATVDDGHGSRTKEVVAILVGAAAVIASATPLLTYALNRLTARPVLVTREVVVPVEDSSGAVVRDATGAPVLVVQQQAEYVSPQEHHMRAEIQGLGLRISLGSAQEPEDPGEAMDVADG